jgi:hypothetical protein
MTFVGAPPAENATDAYPMTRRRRGRQNRVLSPVPIFGRWTPVRVLHVAFRIPYIYGYINKSYRTKTEAILKHVSSSVGGIGQGKVISNLAAVRPTFDLPSNLNFRVVT